MARALKLDAAAAFRPHPFETVCGDATVIRSLAEGLLCAIIDGVGHGRAAHLAASNLAACVGELATTDPSACLEAMRVPAQGTIGAAVGVLHLHAGTGQVTYSGLGNISARICGRAPHHFVSRDGVVGTRSRSLLQQTAVVGPGDVVLLHTDGIVSDCASDRFPAMFVRSAADVAAAIVRRFAKPHDDAACIVIRVN